MEQCTIFENIYADKPNFISIDAALARIRDGRSKAKIEEIRQAYDKEKADAIKRQLPSVCFSGLFSKRHDNCLTEHSGFLVLDFDNVNDISEKMAELAQYDFIYSSWVSPRGNGVKALVRIADGTKHREHFAALKEIFKDADASGVNESRVCYESYDPKLTINKDCKPFTKYTVQSKIMEREVVQDDREVFSKLLKWISNKGGAFVKGERNTFIFRLASACCRFGLQDSAALDLILMEFPASNDFTFKEAANTVKSAYRGNSSKAGSAQFDKERLVDRVSRKEVEIKAEEIDMDAPSRDVVYGAHVRDNAIAIFKNGYESVNGVGVAKIDELYKMKKGEVTCLTGIGNYGKSTFYKWMVLLRVILFGEKFASFSPEDNPPEEYYHDFVEMLLGCNCTPYTEKGVINSKQPNIEYYINAYDFISQHIFYLYPQNTSPTPDCIKERFLELIVKEKISGASIDPWNQQSHEYTGRSDQYLEGLLGDYGRFAQLNQVYMFIIAHPNKMPKETDKNYACPDVFDLAGGAMWNNKMDNILVYHRPHGQTDPQSPLCEFHSKKIRRQKTVGKKGTAQFEYKRGTRRFEVDGHDPISEALRKNKLSFDKPVINYKPVEIKPPSADNFYAGFQKPTDRLPENFWNNK
jgi:hypothetical protein